MGGGKLHECRAARPTVEEVSSAEQSSNTIPGRTESVLTAPGPCQHEQQQHAESPLMPPRFYSLFLLDMIETLNHGLAAADAILHGSKQPQNKWLPWMPLPARGCQGLSQAANFLGTGLL